MKPKIEWSGDKPGSTTCYFTLDDLPDDAYEVEIETSFDDMTDSLIEFCGGDGVVEAPDDIVFIEAQAAALERVAARLRSAIIRP